MLNDTTNSIYAGRRSDTVDRRLELASPTPPIFSRFVSPTPTPFALDPALVNAPLAPYRLVSNMGSVGGSRQVQQIAYVDDSDEEAVNIQFYGRSAPSPTSLNYHSEPFELENCPPTPYEAPPYVNPGSQSVDEDLADRFAVLRIGGPPSLRYCDFCRTLHIQTKHAGLALTPPGQSLFTVAEPSQFATAIAVAISAALALDATHLLDKLSSYLKQKGCIWLQQV